MGLGQLGTVLFNCTTCYFLTCSFLKLLLCVRQKLDKIIFQLLSSTTILRQKFPACLKASGLCSWDCKKRILWSHVFPSREFLKHCQHWILCQTIAEAQEYLSQSSVGRTSCSWCFRTLAPLGITGTGKKGRSWQLWGCLR